MKNESKEVEKVKELLKEAENHPMVKTIRAEEAAKVLQLRQDAAGRIEQAQKEAGAIIP